MKIFLLFTLITVTIRGEEITSIATGTGFSSCTGYCYNSIRITGTTLVTLKTSKTNVNDYPNVEQQYTIDSSEFNQLIDYVGDIQLWKSVDSPIGCPDCSGQGLEWIDVYTDTQPKYGVTFEYNSTISGYEPLVEYIRTIRQQYLSAK